MTTLALNNWAQVFLGYDEIGRYFLGRPESVGIYWGLKSAPVPYKS